MTDRIKAIAANKGLSPQHQRILWARVTTVKRLLIRAGLTTHEEFEEMVSGMVRDIEQKTEEAIRKSVGADDDDDHSAD